MGGTMGMSTEKRAIVAGNTSAVRVADHRSKHVRLDVSLPPRMGATVDDLASFYGCTKAEVVRSMLRFALTNRDWKTQGLIWGD